MPLFKPQTAGGAKSFRAALKSGLCVSKCPKGESDTTEIKCFGTSDDCVNNILKIKAGAPKTSSIMKYCKPANAATTCKELFADMMDSM